MDTCTSGTLSMNTHTHTHTECYLKQDLQGMLRHFSSLFSLSSTQLCLLCCIGLEVVTESKKAESSKGVRLLKVKVGSAVLRSVGHLQLEVQLVIKVRTGKNLR